MNVPLDALIRRESAAWAAVYEHLVDGVYQHALYRLGGDREAAEAVTQEVFMRAIESIAGFNGADTNSSLLVWLRGIARRVIARGIRDLRPVAARALSLDAAPETDRRSLPEPADPGPTPDQRLMLEDEQLLAGAALTALPTRWEQVLRWKYCEDMSVAEIAERLGVSAKAAESLLSRARAAFREVHTRMAERGLAGACDIEEWPDE